MQRRALLVGINHYDHYPPLLSSIKDAKDMKSLLETHEPLDDCIEPNFHCTLLLSNKYPDKKITRVRLHRAIDRLFNESTPDTELVLLYFSGHGFESNLGGYLVTQDARDMAEGVSVNDILIYANNSRVKNIVILVDCCYSGHMGDIPFLKSSIISLRDGISILTASSKKQVALETLRGGYFTEALLSALRGTHSDMDGTVNINHLYQAASAYLKQEDQNPSLKTNLSQLPMLRKTPPRVPLATLQKLPFLFDSARHQRPLDESHLSDSKDAYEDHVTDFGHLLLLETQGLVKPCKSSSLLVAAKEGEKCSLSPQGVFYWQMMWNRARMK